MKQANYKEMDLLLRSLARQREKSGSQNGSSFDGSSEGLSEHLDADELNSYAEGVVPAPARLRYQEHLADCETCRSIVIDLSQAAGATARYEVPQQQGESSFWQTVMAVFSPAVLRFAVPALVLTTVIGIGFFALLQRPGNEMVAVGNKAEPSQSAIQPQSAVNSVNSSGSATSASPPAKSEVDRQTLNEPNERKVQPEKALERDQPVSAPVAKAAAGKDAASGEGAGIITTQPYSPEPKADAAPPPAVVFDSVEKSAELAKERPAKREDQGRSRDEFRNQVDEEHGPSRSRNNQIQAPASQRNVGGLRAARGPSDADKKKAGAAEYRSISGRRFTREDNGWIDTDYSPARATIRITRGSDQYRALVADEPGIRTIADQLSGVVIVVWKSRAYRIQ